MDTTWKGVTDCNERQTERRRKCAKVAKLRATRITMAPGRYVASQTELNEISGGLIPVGQCTHGDHRPSKESELPQTRRARKPIDAI